MLKIAQLQGLAVSFTRRDGADVVVQILLRQRGQAVTHAPGGYQLDETVYDCKIEEDGQLVEHIRENLRIPDSITVLKTYNDGCPALSR